MRAGRYRLKLIGAFALFAPDGAPLPIASKRAKALLAALAMAEDGRRKRVWLQDMLWTSRSHPQAQSSLRRELSNLRRAIGGGEDLLWAGYDEIALLLDRIDVDARAAPASPAPAMLRAEFLEGLDIPDAEGFNDWMSAQRAALDPRRAAAPPLFAAPSRETLRPSIAVFPFDDLSATAEHRALADGVSEEVCSALSRYSTLEVVWAGARNDAAAPDLSSRAAVTRHLAAMGVRYLLAGSVQPAGDRVRVTARLYDGLSKKPVWSQRFEDRLEDVFELQDRIAGIVAPHVDSSVEKHERRRATARPVQGADACQLYWRANAAFRSWTKDGMRRSAELATQVLDLEPGNAWAASLAAFCNAVLFSLRWSDDPQPRAADAMRHYETAMAAGGDDPFVLGYCAGTLLMLGGDRVAADRLIARALEIHPNAASTLFWGAWVDLWNGNPQRGRQRFETAMRVNPRSAVRPFSIAGLGLCALADGEAEEAVSLLKESLQFLPAYPLTLAGLYVGSALIGQDSAARIYLERLREIGGAQTASAFFSRPEQQALLAKAVESRAAAHNVVTLR